MVGFNFTPQGWLACDGSQVAISEYETLFTLIGVTYGGDGQTNFNLPDLRGRVPVDQGTGIGPVVSMGQVTGSESVSLTAQQVGAHNHMVNTGPAGNTAVPGGAAVLADIGGAAGTTLPNTYAPTGGTTAMAAQSIGNSAGGSQPHENRQPLLTINYIISPFGIYPTQT